MKHVSILSTILLAHLLAVDGTAESIRLSGGVYRGQRLDAPLTDFLEVELSRHSGVQVLDRRHIDQLVQELAIAATGRNPIGRLRLGRLLRVDVFVWLRLTENGGVLEIVEAATGRGLAVKRIAFKQEKLKAHLRWLATQAVDIAKRGAKPLDNAKLTLGLATPLFPQTSSAAWKRRLDALLTSIEQDFQKAGATRLHRRFTSELITENWWQEVGFTEAQRKRLPLLGARLVLVPRLVAQPPKLELGLLDTSTGRRVGLKGWSFQEAETSAGRREILLWLRQQLQRLRPAESKVTTAANAHHTTTVAVDRIAPETLEVFYKGLLLHNQGRYFEAMPLFRDAYQRDNRLREPIRWLRSCYRLTGFKEIDENYAAQMRNAKNNPFRFSAPSARIVQSDPGVSLLGVTAGPGERSTPAGPLGMLLIDSLHVHTGLPVLLAEDLASLREEYDLLVGLEHTRGTTWQTAPPLLLTDAVTAHLRKEDGKLRLRLCSVRHLDPMSIRAVTVTLDDGERWKKKIEEAVAQLYPADGSQRGAWKPPAPVIGETESQLLARLKVRYHDEDCLKLLALNPAHIWYVGRFPLRRREPLLYRTPAQIGLEAWAIRQMPLDHPERPWFEFAYLKYFGPHTRPDRNVANPPDYLTQLKRLANRYPKHLVGLVSRYNLMLFELSPNNYESVQQRMAKIIAEVEAAHSPRVPPHTLAAIKRMESALRYVLRKPGGRPAKLIRDGFCIQATHYPRSSTVGMNPGALTGNPTLENELLQPDSLAKMHLELRAYLMLRDHDAIPPSFYRKLIQRYGSGSDPVKYAVLRFGQVTTNRRLTEEMKADLAVLCAAYGRAVVELFQADPVPLRRYEPGSVVHNLKRLARRWPADGAFVQPYKLARDAALRAFVEGRLHHLSDPDVELFFRLIAQDNDPECEAIVRNWAKGSWDNDPLTDHRWLAYTRWKKPHGTKLDVANAYREYLPRLHQRYDHQPKTARVARLYGQFVIVFYRAGDYQTARPLLEQIVNWRDDKGEPPAPETHALALYLLALLHQGDGNTPRALELATKSLTYVGDQPVHLGDNITPNGRFDGSRRGVFQTMISELITQLRKDPQTPFKNPFGPTDKW